MMNRSVMQRQMFKKGGVAGFPDLSGDGKVTQKDILMGRGVVEMQAGGDPMAAMMAQQAPAPAPMMPPQAMPPQAMPPQAMPPQAMPPQMAGAPAPAEPEMGLGGVGEVDQNMVEQMLADVAPAVGDPEQAEDFESMMNAVRGDEATMEQRRMELATLVGEEDAMKTPESVLALVQPVVQIASVDQGIGALAQEEMQEPVQGDMAGGIMSMMGG